MNAPTKEEIRVVMFESQRAGYSQIPENNDPRWLLAMIVVELRAIREKLERERKP